MGAARAILIRGGVLAALCGPWAMRASAEDAQLNIYNWADYIGKGTVPALNEAAGIKVVYDTYDSDAGLEAKVMAGDSGYDLVTTSTDFFSRQIKAGVYQVLDRSKPAELEKSRPRHTGGDRGVRSGQCALGAYLRGVNGFAYNVDLIKARMPDAPVDSLDMIFKPELIAKFADCGVSFMDNAEDVLQLALNYLHLDPNTPEAGGFQGGGEAVACGAPVRAHVRFRRIHECIAEQGVVHCNVLVRRLRNRVGARQGRRRYDQPSLHRSAGGCECVV